MKPSPTRSSKPVPLALPAEISELLSPRIFFIATLFLAAAVFAVYGSALQFEFILDDHRFTGDPRIQMPDHVWEYFSNFVWAQFTGGPPSFYRPVFLLWMRINFIFSGLSPWGWHLLSTAKHVAVVGLLAWLVWKLLRDRGAVLVAGALFALHPAQAESVAWVTVPDPLMAIAVLGTLFFYLRYRDGSRATAESRHRKSRKDRRAEREPKSPARWLIGSVVCAFAALLSKETAIVLPVVIFALAAFRPQTGLSAQPASEDLGLAARWVPALRQTGPYLVVTAFYLLLRLNAFGGSLGAASQHLPWKTVLLSLPGVLWFYAKVMLWPVRSYAFADSALAEGWSVRGVLLPGLGIVAVAAALGALLFWMRQKARRELSPEAAARIEFALLIGILLLVLPILPALNVNALNPGDFLHGRYTYLPLAGLTMLLATGWHLAGIARIPLLVVASVIASACGALTMSQEKMWQDDLTVFTTAHQLAPHNAPVAQNLANAHVRTALQLADEGRCADAVPVFEQVTRDYPQDWYAWAALGDCQVQLDKLSRAEESFHRAADLSHDSHVIEHWQQLREHMGLPSITPAH